MVVVTIEIIVDTVRQRAVTSNINNMATLSLTDNRLG